MRSCETAPLSLLLLYISLLSLQVDRFTIDTSLTPANARVEPARRSEV